MSDLTVDLRRSAGERPNAPAVEFQGRGVTYRELDERSAALATTLRGLGAGPETRVAIWLRKSVESIVAIHGVLRTGAAYVPIDPSAPPRRVGRILADCAVVCVVTDHDQVGQLTEPAGPVCPVIAAGLAPADATAGVRSLDEALSATAEPATAGDVRSADDPAYILYTSGSKGTPKGVTVSHRNARAFIDWAVDEFRMTPSDRVASHAPLHFDLSILDVFATCRAGACVVLIPQRLVGFGAALNAFVAERRITLWYSVPNALSRMLNAKNHASLARSSLRVVLFAGETFPVGHLRQLRRLVAPAALYNLYGPTETNVCTYHQVRDDDVASGRTEPAPIGRPCPYATAFVVDETGRPVDPRPGKTGELLIAGDSVMLGYWGDEELTAARMVEVVQPDGVRVAAYRTGDMVRYDDDLSLVFCGREDDMVKIRGYRVEIGEIESVISTAAQIREVACVPVGQPTAVERIDAYVVVGDEPFDPAALRRHCSTGLPRYMVPERIHVVDDLPRTASGKIDRRALTAS